MLFLQRKFGDRCGFDTIYAFSSAGGRAGVAVIRVSGPAVSGVVEALTGGKSPPPREAALRRLVDPENGAALDRALGIRFAGPQSFTGEDVAEFHVHGGRAGAIGSGSCRERVCQYVCIAVGAVSSTKTANKKIPKTTTMKYQN